MKVGAIEFDDCIEGALRDDQLMVFAGAGVSVGPPSDLPNFKKLTEGIGQTAMRMPTVAEPLDRFLGRLEREGFGIRARAMQLLSSPNSRPNSLHRDLLRFFRSVEKIKLITTNFDQHFETAAQNVFEHTPEIYCAPALPRGGDFSGIVHVHGALTHQQDMVLTDADFGRAYLTEGWARRFLVDVFRKYTVLFVGYSHDDVVMNYLARALPADGDVGRYVLTDESQKSDKWNFLGIQPIHFNKGVGEDAYKELNEGIHLFADRVNRGALDWKARVAEICSGAPPEDEMVVDEVKQALREIYRTRFFVDVAHDKKWPKWLDSHGYLEALFDIGELSEQDKLLAKYLAEHFAIEYPEVMFALIANHRLQLNREFWILIGQELGVRREKPIEEKFLRRWITILLTSLPDVPNNHVLMWLAERCANCDAKTLTLKIFLTISDQNLTLEHSLDWPDIDGQIYSTPLSVSCSFHVSHYVVNEIWTKYLKPDLPAIAQPLLSGITRQFEDMHQTLEVWNKASREWDMLSIERSAIEPHEQDQYLKKPLHVLIDSARDALEWLASNSPQLLDAWIERLIDSEVPLLRRLAIYAITVHPDMTADERLRWVIERVGLYEFAEHHEIHRVVALSYPEANKEIRQDVINAVLAHKSSAGDQSEEENTAREHFDWLSWLVKSKPDCSLAITALKPIQDLYPDWEVSKHPDLHGWVDEARWVKPQSPWTVEQLVSHDPGDQLEDLLNFKGDSFNGPDRDGLMIAIKEACQQHPDWAFKLLKQLSEKSLWNTDMWPATLSGLQEAELTVDDWRALLDIVAQSDLQTSHARDIANLLHSFVKNDGKPFTLDLLDQANDVALSLWQSIKVNDNEYKEIDDWLTRGINEPGGIIVRFWLSGLSLLMRGKQRTERTLPANYKEWFAMALQESALKGGFGRCLLASHIAFLFSLDEDWAKGHLIPLFTDSDKETFRQAWDGFLTWGQFYPALSEAMTPVFIEALRRADNELAHKRVRFIELYTTLSVLHTEDPTQELLPKLLIHGTLEDRSKFASKVGYFLHQMQPETKQRLWNRWLCKYWQQRIDNMPVSLDKEEVKVMLEWLPYLGESFSKAVSLAVQAPSVDLGYSDLLFELRENNLVEKHPNKTAELLIYLCNGSDIHHQANDLKIIADRLTKITPSLRHKLDDGLANAGAN